MRNGYIGILIMGLIVVLIVNPGCGLQRTRRMGRSFACACAIHCRKASLIYYIIKFILVLSFLNSSYCKSTSPSSCGNIQNITCPFTLKGDHQKCSQNLFSKELSCQNNRTTITLNPHKLFYVESINYEKLSIRLVDPGLEKNNYSSLPLHLIQQYDYSGSSNHFWEHNHAVRVIQCMSPAKSERYIAINSPLSISSSLVLGKSYAYSYSYFVIGRLAISEIEDNCRISKATWFSSESPLSRNLSTSSFYEIHDGMVFGFDVHWSYFSCLDCKLEWSECIPHNHGWSCDLNNGCLLSNPKSYHPPVTYCVVQNIRGMLDTLKRYRIKEIFGLFLAARFLCGIPFLLALLAYIARRRHLSMYDTIEDFLKGRDNLIPIRYAYSDIKRITDNFKDELGEGGFGTVYKGKLRSGLFVAVKILGKSKATAQQFINEVATSGRIHHVSVVQLIGFCFEGRKRALIYEFMPNGSLEKYIFSREGKEEKETNFLSWEKMYEISCKVASGIDYLHRGCDMQILHFDIKPHNILLDKNFNPKISDFGLAKLYATDDSIVTLTAARGTMGYMAPEMFYKNIGGVSYKADVYSFGMLLLEMAGQRKKLNPFADHISETQPPSRVYDEFSKGKCIEMEDVTEEERKLVTKMIIVALWCIQMKPSERPSMNKVIEMLEGDIEVLVMPPKPFLYPEEEATEIVTTEHIIFNLLPAENE